MLLVTMLFLCLPPGSIDNRTATWTKQDQAAFERAAQRCKEIDPEYPCLKKFIKLDEHRYQVWCTKDESKD